MPLIAFDRQRRRSERASVADDAIVVGLAAPVSRGDQQSRFEPNRRWQGLWRSPVI
jgi:hypothetical protein